MSVAWTQTLQRRLPGARRLRNPLWLRTLDIGPCVSFVIQPLGAKFGVAQAYPVGTGDSVSSVAERIMDEALGAVRYGVRNGRLLVQLSDYRDIAAFTGLGLKVSA